MNAREQLDREIGAVSNSIPREISRLLDRLSPYHRTRKPQDLCFRTYTYFIIGKCCQ